MGSRFSLFGLSAIRPMDNVKISWGVMVAMVVYNLGAYEHDEDTSFNIYCAHRQRSKGALVSPNPTAANIHHPSAISGLDSPS